MQTETKYIKMDRNSELVKMYFFNADNGEKTITDYHKQRVSEKIFSFNGKTERNAKTVKVLLDNNTLNLIQAIQREKFIIGGWYLHKEHREWLKKQIIDYIKETSKKEINILEAGVASYKHHFTYMAILNEVIDYFTGEIDINVTVADKFHFPLYQIEICNDNPIQTEIDYNGFKFKIDTEVIAFAEQSQRIRTNLWQKDLSEPVTIKTKFDIITEHLLFLFLNENEQNSFISNINKMLVDNGKLLCFKDVSISEINQQKYAPLKLNIDKSLPTWDIYKLCDNLISCLIKNKKVSLDLNQTLAVFDKLSSN